MRMREGEQSTCVVACVHSIACVHRCRTVGADPVPFELEHHQVRIRAQRPRQQRGPGCLDPVVAEVHAPEIRCSGADQRLGQ